MHDPFRHRIALLGPQLDDGAVLDLDDEQAVDDVEEFVGIVMLVPVELALDDAEPDDRIVDPAKGLVEPLVADLGSAGA